MDMMETIRARRSVRKYEKTPISEADLKEILEAALWAPSAVNLQPWYFVAITGQEHLTQLARIMENVSAAIEPDLKRRFAKHPEVVEETTAFVRKMGGAPVCILVFVNRREYAKTDQTIYQSIGAAIENLLLAATSKGLGTCWLTAPVEAGVQDELRDMFAPDKGPLAAMITLGYPAQEPKAPARKDQRYMIV